MPLDLLDSQDPVISGVPREFLINFNPQHAGRRVSPWLLKKHSIATLAAADYLRSGWQKFFGDARNLNDERFAAAAKLLQAYTVREIAWAIVAYHHKCTTDPGRVKNPSIRRGFTSWMGCADMVESCITQGDELHKAEELRCQAVAARNNRLRFMAVWNELPADTRKALLEEVTAGSALPKDPEYPPVMQQLIPRVAKLRKEGQP